MSLYRQRIKNDNDIACRFGRKSRSKCCASCLFRKLCRQVTRMRAKDDTAVPIMWRGDRTLTSTSGTFLAIRLASTTSHFSASFGVACVLAAVGRFVDYGLMHQAWIDFCTE